MVFWIAFAVLVVLYAALCMPGWGKFWHKHEWYHFMDHTTPSMYSDKKIIVHDIYKCSKDNCWGFKINSEVEKVGSK